MEPRGCNRWRAVARAAALNRRKQGQTVAPVATRGLRFESGRGSIKAPHTGLLSSLDLRIVERGGGVKPFLEPSGPGHGRGPRNRRKLAFSERPLATGPRSAHGLQFAGALSSLRGAASAGWISVASISVGVDPSFLTNTTSLSPISTKL
jgi:hypothetical protein